MRYSRIALPVLISVLVPSAIFILSAQVSARVGIMCRELPTEWPEEARALWQNSLTIDVSHGISENAYEIKFNDRDTFENAWPHILELKDNGAPIILESNESYYDRSGTTLIGPGVRILTPSGRGRAKLRERSWVDIGPPWPEYLYSAEGVLPEYVSLTDVFPFDDLPLDPPMWVTWQPDAPREGRAYRARVDIMVVVDGDIVDLNRIKLPPDTPIVDQRSLGNTPAADTAE